MSAPPRHPVLIHGFTGSSTSWGPAIIDGMAGAGLPPVLFDLPGHGRWAGRTAPEHFTLEGTCERLGEIVDGDADLVGYSMGARIALHFAAARPRSVRRLVLESGSPGLATEGERSERRREDEALADRLVESGISAFVEEWEARPLFSTRMRLDPEVLAFQRSLRLRNDAGSLAAALRGLGTGVLPSLWEVLPDLWVPTLLIVGAEDPKFVDIAERVAAVMKDARVAIVEGAGHTVHLERPAAWLEAVTDFLR